MPEWDVDEGNVRRHVMEGESLELAFEVTTTFKPERTRTWGEKVVWIEDGQGVRHRFVESTAPRTVVLGVTAETGTSYTTTGSIRRRIRRTSLMIRRTAGPIRIGVEDVYGLEVGDDRRSREVTERVVEVALGMED